MSRKFRVTKQFSQNALTGFPENNYMVEYKDTGKDWWALRMYVTREEADKVVEQLEAEEQAKKDKKNIKLDLFSRLKQ